MARENEEDVLLVLHYDFRATALNVHISKGPEKWDIPIIDHATVPFRTFEVSLCQWRLAGLGDAES